MSKHYFKDLMMKFIHYIKDIETLPTTEIKEKDANLLFKKILT